MGEALAEAGAAVVGGPAANAEWLSGVSGLGEEAPFMESGVWLAPGRTQPFV